MEPAPLAKLLSQVKHLHLIGLGGSGMGGAARILLSRGYSISGSDGRPFSSQEDFTREGVAVHIGHCAENLPEQTQLVVESAAIPEENPELREAKRRGLPIVKYANLLGALMEERHGIAVAGTHGKTTTTSMIAWALQHSGLEPGYLIGGSVPQLGGNAAEGGGKLFVAEACEFDRSFLNLSPEIAVITNIDRDHLDYYQDLKEIEAAFSQFAKRLKPGGVLVLGRDVASRIDWPSHVRVLRVGVEIRPDVISEEKGRYRFRLQGEGLESLGEIALRVPGRFNVENAAAAAAALSQSQFLLFPQQIRDALSRYAGALRRFTLQGERDGVTVVDDYGHHPTEIRVVLQAARQVFPGRRLLLAFQPHQASRTRILFEDFVEVLLRSDFVFLPDIYRARDSEEDWRSVSSGMLAERVRERGGKALYRARMEDLLADLESTAKPGDVLITMGAGNIYELGERFLLSSSRQSAKQGESQAVHHA